MKVANAAKAVNYRYIPAVIPNIISKAATPVRCSRQSTPPSAVYLGFPYIAMLQLLVDPDDKAGLANLLMCDCVCGAWSVR